MSYWRLDVPKLAQAVDTVRQYQGLSKRGLARKLGISASTTTRLSQGGPPSSDALMAICKWLNADLRDFAIWHTDKREETSEQVSS